MVGIMKMGMKNEAYVDVHGVGGAFAGGWV